MAQVPLNYGLSAEDGTGDPLRTIFTKIQSNLSDLDGRLLSTTSIVNKLGGAAFLNVGSAPGTVADGGQVAANTAAIANEISRAQTAELLKAPIFSPSFTGVPTAPTAAAGTGTTQIATTAFVATAVAAGGGGGGGGGTGGVPTSRQILGGGLATGGGDLTADRTITVPKAAQSDVATGTDDAKALTSFSIAAALGAKAALASPVFVGVPQAPTPSGGSNTNQIANTAYLATYYAPLASPALTGSPTAPTQGVGDNSTKLSTTAYADRAAANAAAAAPIPAGTAINYSRATSSAYTNITAQVPSDDTVPQSNETVSVVSVSHTPKSATSLLHVRAVFIGSMATVANAVAGIFQGTNASASAVANFSPAGSNYLFQLIVDSWSTSGGTSPITFALRAGSSSSNLYVNGNGSGRIYGGSLQCLIEVTEFAQ